jgi:hypothetical protein
VSRTTIANYLAVLEATFVAHVVRPFTSHSPSEIVAAPKVYAFDTGFVCYYRGWHALRTDDLGLLWEHYVLNELHANLQSREIHYWRDKQGHELDFVLARRGQPPVVVECKWKADAFDPAALLSFRRRYPQGANYVVAQNVDRPYSRNLKGIELGFVPLSELVTAVTR